MNLPAQSPLPLFPFTLGGYKASGPVKSIRERMYMFQKTDTGLKAEEVLTDDLMLFNRSGWIQEERVKYEGKEKAHRTYRYVSGRLMSRQDVTRWGGIITTWRYDFRYDSVGRLLEWVEYDLEEGPSEAIEHRSYTYDAAGVLRAGTYWGSSGAARESFVYSYPGGGVIAEYRRRVIHHNDGDTNLWGTYGTLYDSLGRTLSEDDTSGIEGLRDPDRTEYRDGLPQSVTFYDAGNKISTYARYIYTFDSRGNWTRQRYETRDVADPETAWAPQWENVREISYYDR